MIKIGLKADLPDIDVLFKEYEDSAVEEIKEICERWLRWQKVKSPYRNHTHNLRNALGYAIIKQGAILHMDILSDGVHPDAVKKTTDFINSHIDIEYGVLLADGMEYASFVESKGFVVLGSAVLHIDNELKNKGREKWQD